MGVTAVDEQSAKQLDIAAYGGYYGYGRPYGYYGYGRGYLLETAGVRTDADTSNVFAFRVPEDLKKASSLIQIKALSTQQFLSSLQRQSSFKISLENKAAKFKNWWTSLTG